LEDLIIADTDVIIDFFANLPPFARYVSELIQKNKLAITSVSVFELYAGVIGKKRLKQVDIFVKSVLIFPLSLIEAAIAAKIFTELKVRGRLMGNQDILIAGICVANSLPLLTKNTAHFAPIKELMLVSV
jgi:predicted nucleic acid-binding protein